jgi:hypothetical protein
MRTRIGEWERYDPDHPFADRCDMFLKQAKANAKRLRTMSEKRRNKFLRKIFDRYDFVVAIVPIDGDKNGYAVDIIKGDFADLPQILTTRHEAKGNALMFASMAEAMAMAHVYDHGHDRGHEEGQTIH